MNTFLNICTTSQTTCSRTARPVTQPTLLYGTCLQRSDVIYFVCFEISLSCITVMILPSLSTDKWHVFSLFTRSYSLSWAPFLDGVHSNKNRTNPGRNISNHGPYQADHQPLPQRLLVPPRRQRSVPGALDPLPGPGCEQRVACCEHGAPDLIPRACLARVEVIQRQARGKRDEI
jgi:hypothetical protein